MLLNKRIPLGYTIRKIWPEFLLVTIISNVVVYLDKNFNVNDYALPLTIAAIIGTAISLVLAFRTAQAYDRWWDDVSPRANEVQRVVISRQVLKD